MMDVMDVMDSVDTVDCWGFPRTDSDVGDCKLHIVDCILRSYFVMRIASCGVRWRYVSGFPPSRE